MRVLRGYEGGIKGDTLLIRYARRIIRRKLIVGSGVEVLVSKSVRPIPIQTVQLVHSKTPTDQISGNPTETRVS